MLGAALIVYPLYLVLVVAAKDVRIIDVAKLGQVPFTAANFIALVTDSTILTGLAKSMVYMLGSTVPALILGLLTALLLNQRFPGRRFLRTLMLVPWAVPSVMASIAFMWILDASYGVFNHMLKSLHLIDEYVPWLAHANTSMVAVIMPTVWKVYPFFTLVLLAMCLFFPIYWMIVSSLYPTSLVLSINPPLIPNLTAMTLDAYAEVFQRSSIVTWFTNSVIVTAGSVALSMAVAVPAGYALSRMRSRGQTIAGFTMLLTRVLPGTLLVIPLFITYSSLHLLNSRVGLILANCTVIIPFAVWLLKGFFDSIPYELEEAAEIDGCGIFGAFWRVVLPLTLPGLGATAAYATVLAWSDYLFVRTFILDRGLWTMTVGAASFIGEFSVQWGPLMAVGVIGIIPVALIFLFLEPLLVRGLAGGAVKG